MPLLSIDEYVSRANGRLEKQGFAPRIEVRGKRLVLRGTLPPKPGSTKTQPYQQRVPLGVSANPAMVDVAERKAKALDISLGDGSFCWTNWTKERSPETIGDWIERMERDYFTRRERTPKSETTWRKDYASVLKKLPSSAQISETFVRKAIEENSNPDTKTRKRMCMAYKSLCLLAGIDCDFKALAGSYGAKAVQPQDVPSDEQIIQVWRNIPSDEWRWAIGIIATFGIRPSELTHCQIDEAGILTVGDAGKTGGRRVWPLYPEWIKDFDLLNTKMPPISGANNTALGSRVNQYLKRNGSPFSAKAPRKSWSVRAILLGVPIELAAYQQGHSVKVHHEMYARWITDETQQRAYDAIMNRPGRPKPPQLD